MKIVTVVGARPQFIKSSSLSRVFKKKKINDIIIHTGQHYDANMSDVFFEELDLPHPGYNLNISHQNHGAMTGKMIQGIEEIMLKEKPEWLIVYGDTNSTLAGVLAASKLNIKIVHIEAGLRSYNMNMPEEINRIVADRLSTKLFCPTDLAVENLKKEGFEEFQCEIYNYGDVMFDNAIYFEKFSKKPKENIPKEFLLCTLHRAENTNSKNKLIKIISSLENIAKDIPIVIPVHPRLKFLMLQYNIYFKYIKNIEPVSFLEMIFLLKNSKGVITDSGGLQKESFFFKKMCVTLRAETEWIELVNNGANYLLNPEEEDIDKKIIKIFERKIPFPEIQIYGDGNSGNKIVNELI